LTVLNPSLTLTVLNPSLTLTQFCVLFKTMLLSLAYETVAYGLLTSSGCKDVYWPARFQLLWF